MTLPLYNDGLDDTPQLAGNDGYGACDLAGRPSLLPSDTVRAGRNLWFDADAVAQTRPGLRLNAQLGAGAGASTSRVQGLCYYDTPGFERTLAVRDGVLYEIATADPGAPVAAVAGPAPGATAEIRMAQLVDRVFMADGSATLRWALFSAGAWSHGAVAQFSNGAAMPAWGGLVAHRFRLFAFDTDGNRLYASAVGQAHAAADWVQTDNLRVGNGEGDPITGLVSGQAGNLIVLCQASAWSVDTSAPSAADWTVQRITGLAGCAAGATVMQVGQDVLFLSRHGVLSLGALSATDSVNPATAISAPMQPLIDRVNWQAAPAAAFAIAWRDLYLLALPLDLDTRPGIFLVYNVRTRRWATPWTSAPASGLGGVTFAGWSAAAVSRFAGRQETLLADTTGRLHKLDPLYEKDDRTAALAAEIESWLTLKAEDHGAPLNHKSPFWACLLFNESTADEVQINLVRDGQLAYPDVALAACEIVADGVQTGVLGAWPLVFPIAFQAALDTARAYHLRNRARYREASLQLVSPRGRLRLRSARLAAFIDTPELTP